MVRCHDGRLGRTYNTDRFIDGKVQVHVFSEIEQAKIQAETHRQGLKAYAMQTGKPPEKRLCAPESLTIVGFID